MRIMSRYYRLLLDDYSTASFTSFRQRLLRYARPIGGLFQSVERGRRNCRATKYILSIYDQFLAGNKKISHSVAYREVPFLVPAKILGTATSVLIDYAWEHINTWECIYKMKCGKAESTHIWVSCYGKYCRCIQTKFTNLLYKNMVKDYVDHDECFLGFPASNRMRSTIHLLPYVC